MKGAVVGRIVEEGPRFEAGWRRQVRFQIYLPLAAGVILLGVSLVAVLWGGEEKARLWADLAVIYLGTAAGIMGLLLLVLFAGLAFGVGWLIAHIPEPARRARELASRVKTGARRATDAIAAPVMSARALGATLRAIAGAARPGSRRH
jgi:hypothetical protein